MSPKPAPINKKCYTEKIYLHALDKIDEIVSKDNGIRSKRKSRTVKIVNWNATQYLQLNNVFNEKELLKEKTFDSCFSSSEAIKTNK